MYRDKEHKRKTKPRPPASPPLTIVRLIPTLRTLTVASLSLLDPGIWRHSMWARHHGWVWRPKIRLPEGGGRGEEEG